MSTWPRTESSCEMGRWGSHLVKVLPTSRRIGNPLALSEMGVSMLNDLGCSGLPPYRDLPISSP